MPRRTLHRRMRAQGGCLSFLIGVLALAALALVAAIVITNRMGPTRDAQAPQASAGQPRRPRPPEGQARHRPRLKAPAQLLTSRQTCRVALPRACGGGHFSASFLKLFISLPEPLRPSSAPPRVPPPRATLANRRPACLVAPPQNRTGPVPEARSPPITFSPSKTDTCLRQFWHAPARCLGPNSSFEAWAARARALALGTCIETATGTQDLGSLGRSLWKEKGGTTEPRA